MVAARFVTWVMRERAAAYCWEWIKEVTREAVEERVRRGGSERREERVLAWDAVREVREARTEGREEDSEEDWAVEASISSWRELGLLGESRAEIWVVEASWCRKCS